MVIKRKKKADQVSGRQSQPVRRILFYFGSYQHPFYGPLLHAPPRGYEYVPSRAVSARSAHTNHIPVAGAGKTGWTSPSKIIAGFGARAASGLHDVALNTLKFLGIPKIMPLRLQPGSGEQTEDAIHVIHSAQYLLLTSRPYVVDFEDASALCWYDYRMLSRPLCRFLMRRMLSSSNCRLILPWTQAAKRSLVNSLDLSKSTHDKIHVVYPAIKVNAQRLQRLEKKKLQNNDTGAAKSRSMPCVRFLFIGKKFYEKGGLETVQAFVLLRERCPGISLMLDIVSSSPSEVISRYEKKPGLRFHSQISDSALDALYAQADVFVLPSHYDTFGFVYLEAMARGLPCIGTDHFATPEIITDGKTGILVKNTVSRFDERGVAVRNLGVAGADDQVLLDALRHPPHNYVAQLCAAMERLALNPALRSRMGRAALQEVTEGRFSITNRIAQLSRLSKYLE